MKKELELEEHRKVGEALKTIRDELQKYLIDNRFKKASWCEQKLCSALNWLDRLKCQLDSLVHDQFGLSQRPEHQNLPTIYYGAVNVTGKSLDELFRLFDETNFIKDRVAIKSGVPRLWSKTYEALWTLKEGYHRHVHLDRKAPRQ